jgi:hypothetical protein
MTLVRDLGPLNLISNANLQIGCLKLYLPLFRTEENISQDRPRWPLLNHASYDLKGVVQEGRLTSDSHG